MLFLITLNVKREAVSIFNRQTNWMIPAIDKVLIWTRRTNSITTARKSILKLVKLQSLVAKCCKMRNI